jgi:hypothetical protein
VGAGVEDAGDVDELPPHAAKPIVAAASAPRTALRVFRGFLPGRTVTTFYAVDTAWLGNAVGLIQNCVL